MPRPKKCKCLNFKPNCYFFKPRGIPMPDLEEIKLDNEEMEAIYLKDYKELDQTEAAKQMCTSQSTFQRILTTGRKKTTRAIVEGKALQIGEEDYLEKKCQKDGNCPHYKKANCK